MSLDISAIFEFIADNPPGILIAGGILFLLIGVIIGLSDPSSSWIGNTILIGVILLIIGILLHIAWLKR
jgi:uncharacterized membrane protein HdeD (DUF308 family)